VSFCCRSSQLSARWGNYLGTTWGGLLGSENGAQAQEILACHVEGTCKQRKTSTLQRARYGYRSNHAYCKNSLLGMDCVGLLGLRPEGTHAKIVRRVVAQMDQFRNLGMRKRNQQEQEKDQGGLSHGGAFVMALSFAGDHK